MTDDSRGRKSHGARLAATCLCTREPAGGQDRTEGHKATRTRLVRRGRASRYPRAVESEALVYRLEVSKSSGRGKMRARARRE